MPQAADRARDALAPLAETLGVDGYVMLVEVTRGGKMEIRIEATEKACEDCLVPPQVFNPLIQDLLHAEGIDYSEFELHYPTGDHPSVLKGRGLPA